MRSLSACPFHISVSFFLLFLFCMYSFVKQNRDALSRRSSINSIQSPWVITLCYNILPLSAHLPLLSLFICPFSICALLSRSLVFLFSPQDLNKTKLQSVIASLPVKYDLWFLLKNNKTSNDKVLHRAKSMQSHPTQSITQLRPVTVILNVNCCYLNTVMPPSGLNEPLCTLFLTAAHQSRRRL